MYPESFFHLLTQKTKKNWRFAFGITFCTGLLVHLFRLTNHLLTWDSVYNFHSSQNAIHLGRCFLTLSCGLSSYYDIQWINGLLSLLYLSLTCVCLTEIFSLQKKTAIFLLCGLTVAFPSVASTFAYMYTADGYFLAQLLACAAVLFTLKYRKGFLPGMLLLALSYGSYQAYVSYAVMIILTWTILQLLTNRFSVRELAGYWMRLLLMGGAGTALYLSCNRILTVLEGAVTSRYNGISDMALPNADRLVDAVKNCVIDFAYFFFGPLDIVNLYKILNAGLLLLLLLLLLWCIWQQKLYRKAAPMLLLLLCLAAMPFACSMIYFLSPGVRYYMLMYAGFSLIYILPVLIYENRDKIWRHRTRPLSGLFLSWGCVVISALIIFNFALVSNISYLYMVTNNEKTFQLVSRMTDRIEQLDNFKDLRKICLTGHFDDYDTISLNLPPAMAGIRDSYIISEQAHFAAVMDTYFGLSLESCSDAEKEMILHTRLYDDMGCWPAPNSVVQYKDIVIIKISEQEAENEKTALD